MGLLLPVLSILFLLISLSSHSWTLPQKLEPFSVAYQNRTAISEFRLVNRRKLVSCDTINPSNKIEILLPNGNMKLPDDSMITVQISGVLVPGKDDWVGLMSTSNAASGTCLDNHDLYLETGDYDTLPLVCDYPVKSQYVSNDPNYLTCKKTECLSVDQTGKCILSACTAELVFHAINIRTDLKAVFFGGGYTTPCVLATSPSVSFANPSHPLHGHLNSIDSTGTSMRLTWVSGEKAPQQVEYGFGMTLTSTVTTFTKSDMCTSVMLPSPAVDFGWHDPGFIHSAVMTGLNPSSSYTYRYGSDAAGWSEIFNFRTPPAAGNPELAFIAFGDMGKTPLDKSDEHYIQPGALSVINAMLDDINSGVIDSVFHIGDISYATGFLVEWDYFLRQITPVASRVAWMTAIGNHERDFPESGSVYVTADSGGECGVAYETYFPMPTEARDKPWYSIEQGPVHFTIISTEHSWIPGSEQYLWMEQDLASVDRARTPWVVFQGHRPFYTSSVEDPLLPNGDLDPLFNLYVEPLLLKHKVDIVLVGHVHNYERTCALYKDECIQRPTRDGLDTYDFTKYPAPVHVIIGMAGFELESFATTNSWSMSRITEFGYARLYATRTEITSEFVSANSKQILDSFKIRKW